MYINSQFEESRLPVLHRLIRNHPLAVFITTDNSGLVVNHFPLIIKEDGNKGLLQGHMPKANKIWQSFENGATAVAVFQGVDSYVTPSWYPSKREHGKVVPTWNYAVVHAHGIPVVMQDRGWLLEHLQELTDKQESAEQDPWKVSDAPSEFTDKLLNQIVGLEIPIARIEGKWKVSQNRPAADQLGVANGLHNKGGESSLAMEQLVMEKVGR